jgi:hypothetical protein
MRLIRNRPAHPSMSPTNPSTHRAEALRAAVPDPCAAAAQQHDPALGGRHEGLGEKCGLISLKDEAARIQISLKHWVSSIVKRNTEGG